MKSNVITCVLSGVGFILALIALILRVINGDPFFPELSIGELMAHPLVWGVISGTIFISAVSPLLGKEKSKRG